MRTRAIRAKTVKKWRATMDSAHPYPVVPNTLNRQFAVAHPNQGLGWRHHVRLDRRALALSGGVMDFYSRRVIAWGWGAA